MAKADQPTIHTYDMTILTNPTAPPEDKILLAAAILSDMRTYKNNPLHSFAFVSTDRSVSVESVLDAIRALPKVSQNSKEILTKGMKKITTPREGETQMDLMSALLTVGFSPQTIASAIHRIVAKPGAIATRGLSYENIFFIDLKKDLTKSVIQTLEAMMETDDDA